MHRVPGKVVLVAVSVALVLGTVAATAGAHKGKGQGKKPMGTIESFDGTTISVEVGEDEAVTATVDDDTKIKVEHRGDRKGQGNPSRGTTDDLVAGAFVLDMKVDDGHLDRIRVRPAPSTGTPTPTGITTPTETPTSTPTETPTETPTPEPSETPTV